ncbi:hypothetical protein ACO0LM_11935 [Undibacterium sp. Di26W]|uniref:hypothetical protein n=1 Tax=Undibacterium sp. Di26W TaxID=3413035 RepID=UPI003BF0CB0D
MSFDTKNGLAEDISASIGYTATTALIDWRGGTSLYVPRTATEDHNIAKLIGMPAFRRLVADFGETMISLPLDYRRTRIQRDRLIGALIGKGTGVDEIARIAGLGHKQVTLIRRELETAGLIPLVLGTEDLLLIEPEEIAKVDEFEIENT